MKKTNLRKLFAVLMSAVMLLCVLAGCGGNNTGTATDGGNTTEATSDVATPITKGMLVVNANAAVNVSYDEEGLVLDLEGADENGNTLVEEYADFVGESCSTVVTTLIKNSSASGLLAEANFVLIKQAVGSTLPGTNFLEELTNDAKAALEAVSSQASLFVLSEADLDANGYIALTTAKDLALSFLGLTEFDLFDGSSTPSNGVYGFHVAADGIEEDVLVDAVTGTVCPGTLAVDEEDLFVEEPAEGDIEVPVEGEESNETTATEATTPPSEEVLPNPVEGEEVQSSEGE